MKIGHILGGKRIRHGWKMRSTSAKTVKSTKKTQSILTYIHDKSTVLGGYLVTNLLKTRYVKSLGRRE